MSDAKYGTGGWSREEIRDRFLVNLDEHGDTRKIRRANAQVCRNLQEAIWEQQSAFEAESTAKAILDAKRAEKTVEVGEKYLGKKPADRFSTKEREALVDQSISSELGIHRIAHYEAALWNRVVDALKSVSKRVDTAAMLEAVDRKVQVAQTPSRTSGRDF